MYIKFRFLLFMLKNMFHCVRNVDVVKHANVLLIKPDGI